MTVLLQPIISAYRLSLQPIPPFTWIGSPISAFDVVAAFRLCLALRQIRDAALVQHLFQVQQKRRTRESSSVNDEKRSGSVGSEVGEGDDVEEYSLAKNIAAVLVVVYGGEAVMCPWLGIPPSFLSSPFVPSLYAGLTALVDVIPSALVPQASFTTELPLSFLDGLTRAFLLCQLIPPVVTAHVVPEVAANPWTLLLSSMVIANTGFLTLNTLSMLHPSGLRLASTPPELRAWGWSTTDLWCAPLTTAIYATLTHAQPFWAGLHALVVSFISSGGASFGGFSGLNETTANADEKLGTTTMGLGPQAQPLDAEAARAACALFLTTLFVTRTLRNFGPAYLKNILSGKGKKKVVMRSRIDGKRYPGTAKKTQ